ncbi:Ornithine decarboxylase [Diplonema papillatum]|nr:Ornithine decarboxylase [Diplonema papillatum]
MSTAVSQWWPSNITEKVDQIATSLNATFINSAEAGLSEDEKCAYFRGVFDASPSHEPMEEPIYLVDLGVLEAQIVQWIKYLPRVRPFYAYKCNGSPVLVETLRALGCGFDCASSAEFQHVIKLGCNPEKDVLFANPCKQVAHIKSAHASGIKYVTFDNIHELPKIKKHWPGAAVIMRIVTDDSKSICAFSSKFGAQLHIVPSLLDTCIELGMNLIGVSFHVGSGCGDVEAFVKAAEDAHRVFCMAAERGIHMNLLDIGGGFPGDKTTCPTFPDIAQRLAPVLDELFPADVQIIAEPGRYFACASHTLATNIFAKREVQFKEDDGEVATEMQYYVNEGVYQSFNCLFFDHALVDARPLFANPADESAATERCTTIFGPTCDGLDCIAKRISFPEMKLGDWMVFHDFGAYTIAAASSFNGFSTTRIDLVRSGNHC